MERLYVFRPSPNVDRTPADSGVPFQQFFLDTSDGERLSVWHLCPERPRASIIYFHGNSGNLALFCDVLTDLYERRLQVMAIDYRGYGWSSGEPSEEGLYQDSLCAVQHFRDHLQIDGIPLVLWGRSLGGPVAAYAAGRCSPDGLVLETTFASKKTLLRAFPPKFRFFSLFSRCKFRTLRNLSDYPGHVLVIHGDQDRTIPIEQGRHLLRGLREPKSFLLMPGADHRNIHEIDRARYFGHLLEFLRALRKPTVH